MYVPVRTDTYIVYVLVRTDTYMYVKKGGELCDGTYLCTYQYVHYNVVWIFYDQPTFFSPTAHRPPPTTLFGGRAIWAPNSYQGIFIFCT